jgi:hypothetical protein
VSRTALVLAGILALLVLTGCGKSGAEGVDPAHAGQGQMEGRMERHRAMRRARMRHRAMMARRHHRQAAIRHRAAMRRLHAEEGERRAAEAAEAEEAAGEEASECDPSYSGACLDPYASDYDCDGGSGDGPDYTGEVTVVGVDHYSLDADGDGIGCESE